jgi:hypothetical protein
MKASAINLAANVTGGPKMPRVVRILDNLATIFPVRRLHQPADLMLPALSHNVDFTKLV